MVATAHPSFPPVSGSRPHQGRSADTREARSPYAGRVLVVEDDPDICAVIRLHLEGAHYQVSVAADGKEGLERALSQPVDLVVLDLGLPELDGLELCRRLQDRRPRPLILMVTARSTEPDRVRGLELGADDYLIKPFSVVELVARVRALLRRPPLAALVAREEPVRLIAAGALVLDRWERCVRLHAQRIELTTREFELLLWFVRHPLRVFSRAELLDAVWGRGYGGFEHTVNSHLNRLRAKLEADASHPSVLVTVRGSGYKLIPPAALPPQPAAT